MSRTLRIHEKRVVSVDGRKIAYTEKGNGSPIVLLHGNPTSSFLWRDVIPALEPLGRVIAPDLIGHGDSEKLPASLGPDRYRFDVAYRFLSDFLEAIDATRNVTLVLHDWGSALGFHWASMHPDQVSAIAYMEGLVSPIESWDDWPEGARGIFQGFRSSKGEDLILRRNLFIEGVLPNSVLRRLSEEEMNAYRKPFAQEEDRQTMLNWPRQLPIAGTPADIVTLVQKYGSWLSQSPVPKLFINADPGSILVGRQREFCRTWPNQTEKVVKGLHFIQEDSGEEIGTLVAEWLGSLNPKAR